MPDKLFHAADGTPIPNCFDHTQQHGVFLIDAEDAVTFQESHQKSTQPCVMVILGPTCPLQNKTCQARNLPATDLQGSKVVIAACAHALGTAKASLYGADQDEIITEATSILASTAWRSEVNDELWTQLCEGPLRAIWKVFVSTRQSPPQS